MNSFYQPLLTDPHLTPEESHHAIRVLRMRVGDTMQLTDGKGTLATAELTSTDERKAGLLIKNTTIIAKRPFSIHLAIAPTKNIDRMEWLVEKCTEIGVERIIFVKCKTSERPSVPMDRLQKLAVSAMKQSQQAWLPILTDMVALKAFLTSVNESQRFIGHADASNPIHLIKAVRRDGDSVLLIGPEGDFTPEEVEMAIANRFTKVSLGPSRLRTETAGLFGVALINGINHKV